MDAAAADSEVGTSHTEPPFSNLNQLMILDLFFYFFLNSSICASNFGIRCMLIINIKPMKLI